MESIICAFLLGGCLCAAFQVIGDYTKAIPPKILLLGIAGGALMAALRLSTALGAFGGAGFGVMVIGFGEGVFMAVQSALAGNWLPAAVNLGVVIALSLIGIVCGAAHLARTKSARPAAGDEAESGAERA